MTCPRCQAENDAGVRFCEDCGARLEAACPSCGTPVTPGKKFCRSCGAALTSGSAGRFANPESFTPKHLAEKILTSKAALEGERKQVTVLFADLKGSMELLDRDPEEARKLLDPVLEHMMDAVHRYEGTVNQVMGDGIMALFGAPLAHEDHAVRACYAALRMQELVKRYSEGVRRSHGIEVQIRVGLNSGEVVVRAIGSDLHMDYTAVGQTTHLAARMEQLATPGSIRLTADTLRLAEGYVEVKSLGPVPVKGLSAPIDVYEATGVGVVRSRLQAATARGLTRFVGRDTEVEQLRKALEQSRTGHGQLVATVGDPGVGKSRLFHEFTHSHWTQDWLILESGSVSYGKATSYLPVIDLLKVYFKVHDRETHREIREKVTGKLLTLDRALEPTLPALLALLDVPVEDTHWQTLDPSQRRQRTLDAVRQLLLRESQLQPLLVIFEDLHWIDSETQALLDSLVERLPTARLLLLVNYRPEYRHGWGSKTYYTQLRLDTLPPESANELLQALLGNDATVEPLKPVLIARTGGNPLFLEESVRTLIETHALTGDRGAYRLIRALDTIDVPATVQAILASRIDRLAPEDKQLLQTASVIGKDVPFALLHAIAELPEDALRRGLAHLQSAEFLYETNLFPDLEYTFKHALTHEVAYATLLQERRRVLHAQILDAMGSTGAESVEVLAHHAVRGEVWDRGVGYLSRAGDKALARSASREAVAYLEQAVAALRHLPVSKESLEQAFDIYRELSNSYHPLAHIEKRREALAEMEQVALALGDERRVARARTALAQYTWLMGKSLSEAAELGENALGTAEASRDTRLLIVVNHHLGGIYLSLGAYERAERVLRHNLRLLDGDLGRERLGMAGFPAVLSRSWLVWTLAERGSFEEAEEIGQTALVLADALENSYSWVQAGFGVARALIWRGEFRRAVELCERALAKAVQGGIALFAPLLKQLLGWSYVSLGRVNEGLQMVAEPNLMSAVPLTQAQYLITLGTCLFHADSPDDALGAAQKGLNLARERGARGEEAQARHLLADIKSSTSVSDAEADYREALSSAVELGMRPLTAHCHLGLGKLYRRTEKRDQAQEHLTTATTMYREMGMRFWLEQAEAKRPGST
jgi:class 3 adenylate cyclase/tetratricopeptide (TPR) repeat protein